MMARVAGRSVLRLQLERMALVENVDGVVLCTTSLATDDVLAAEGEDVGAACYRGDPEDVPARLLGAARFFQTEVFALVEGDEVFTDPDYVAQALFMLQKGTADLIKVEGLPIGSWMWAIRTDALERLCDIKGPGPVDGWSRYFYDSTDFRVESIQPDPPLPTFNAELRLTLDYPEDLALVQAIADRLVARGLPVRLRPALQLLNEEPELLEINRHLNDVWWQLMHAMLLPRHRSR
jgi:spore coat polysaccharide biosynthesis protein SpsF (cytidylyltransferase family)